jgi:hypothetical protein
MSDVEQGGATVFSAAGGHLKPKKGSAVFWYNLFASGEGEQFTYVFFFVYSILFFRRLYYASCR